MNFHGKSYGAILEVIVNYSQGKPIRPEADYEAVLVGDWAESPLGAGLFIGSLGIPVVMAGPLLF
ncbi:MAG: hypothetical protein ABSE06_17485 [Anaerolineaceae bacterium]|jgi:hypothetical protein